MKDINDTIINIATFAQGAYLASDNRAFNTIYENLLAISDEIENTEPIGKLMNQSIEELKFTQRTYNCLFIENIKLVKDLLNFRAIDLLKIPNLGHKSLKEIESVLAENGLKLK